MRKALALNSIRHLAAALPGAGEAGFPKRQNAFAVPHGRRAPEWRRAVLSRLAGGSAPRQPQRPFRPRNFVRPAAKAPDGRSTTLQPLQIDELEGEFVALAGSMRLAQRLPVGGAVEGREMHVALRRRIDLGEV